MTKEEAMGLSEELWELSEFEEQNKERMLEIARILVDFYLPNKKHYGDNKLWEVLKANQKDSQQKILH